MGAAALLVIWVVALGAMWFARSQKMTSEKVLDYISANSLHSKSDVERMKMIEELGRRVNQLSFEERQKLRFEKSIRSAYEGMTDAERARYLDLTLPGGMKQMMEAFNAMEPAKRKQMVNRAVNELQRAQNEGTREELDKALNDQNLKRIIDQGLKSYMTDANASAKLDIQPLMEQMQSILQISR